MELQLQRPGGRVDMEGEDIDGIAHPFDALAARPDDQAGEFVELAGGRMVAGQPLREEQDQRPGLGDRNGLMHLEDAPADVGRVDR